MLTQLREHAVGERRELRVAEARQCFTEAGQLGPQGGTLANGRIIEQADQRRTEPGTRTRPIERECDLDPGLEVALAIERVVGRADLTQPGLGAQIARERRVGKGLCALGGESTCLRRGFGRLREREIRDRAVDEGDQLRAIKLACIVGHAREARRRGLHLPRRRPAREGEGIGLDRRGRPAVDAAKELGRELEAGRRRRGLCLCMIDPRELREREPREHRLAEPRGRTAGRIEEQPCLDESAKPALRRAADKPGHDLDSRPLGRRRPLDRELRSVDRACGFSRGEQRRGEHDERTRGRIAALLGERRALPCAQQRIGGQTEREVRAGQLAKQARGALVAPTTREGRDPPAQLREPHPGLAVETHARSVRER